MTRAGFRELCEHLVIEDRMMAKAADPDTTNMWDWSTDRVAPASVDTSPPASCSASCDTTSSMASITAIREAVLAVTEGEY